MKKPLRVLLPLAAAAALPLAIAPAASADSPDWTGQATMNAMNGSGGTGMFTVWVNGDQATVKGHWSGLASTFQDGPFPHAQHIHGMGQGQCPTMSDDENGDGIVDTVEGQPAYGKIQSSLTTKGDTSPDAALAIKAMPGGSSTDYNRTFTLNDKTMEALQSGSAVIVVHGLDPSTLSDEAAKAKSNLDPKLPLAATAPALCGTVSSMPSGGAGTGGGSTAGADNLGLLGLGGGLLAAAGGFVVLRRRRESATASQR